MGEFTPIHEAAHAVAFVGQGIEVVHATIARMTCDGRSTAGHVCRAPLPPQDYDERTAKALSIMCLAGPLAAIRAERGREGLGDPGAFDWSTSGKSDYETASALAFAADLRLTRIMSESIDLVLDERFWDVVEAVATDLKIRTTVSGSDVALRLGDLAIIDD
jgi:hypothetical protein